MAGVGGAVGGVAHSSQLSWLAQSEEEAVHDDLHQLLSETRGVVEKLAEPAVKLVGSWQLVLWQPRWVFAEIDGLCYQKIWADESPIGKPKKIMFAAVETIEELDCAEFVLQCGKRDFTFKAPSEDACTVLVHNLRQLRERAAREKAARDAEAPVPANSRTGGQFPHWRSTPSSGQWTLSRPGRRPGRACACVVGVFCVFLPRASLRVRGTLSSARTRKRDRGRL